MKIEGRIVVLCLLALSLCLVVGCNRKPTEEKPQGTAEPQPQGTQTQTPQAAPPQTAQPQAVSVDIQKPVAEVQAEAQTMTVDDLKATALKYKEAIVNKQADVEKLFTKIKEIPITEALGQEAKTLKTDLKSLETTVSALKERYQVYYNTLKEKGGDLSGLTL
jgi:hypothetical protein